MAAKLTRPTHKIAIRLHCSPRSRRPVRRLLDIPSHYPTKSFTSLYLNQMYEERVCCVLTKHSNSSSMDITSKRCFVSCQVLHSICGVAEPIAPVTRTEFIQISSFHARDSFLIFPWVKNSYGERGGHEIRPSRSIHRRGKISPRSSRIARLQYGGASSCRKA
jgi:hypothetical protein